jgi:hypothetical protein
VLREQRRYKWRREEIVKLGILTSYLVLFTKCYQYDQIEKDEMCGACSKLRGDEKWVQ